MPDLSTLDPATAALVLAVFILARLVEGLARSILTRRSERNGNGRKPENPASKLGNGEHVRFMADIAHLEREQEQIEKRLDRDYIPREVLDERFGNIKAQFDQIREGLREVTVALNKARRGGSIDGKS